MTATSILDAIRQAVAAKQAATAPPVIPQIAKAYQNDPRTQLAQSAIQSGTSTAPVATRGYGVADGIARMLNAGIGGYINTQQEQKYGKREADLSATLQKLGVNGLTGMALPGAPATPATPPPPSSGTLTGAPLTPSAPPASMGGPQAAQVASALGAPPPGAGGPPGAPPGPSGGPPPGMPPGPPPGAPMPGMPPSAPNTGGGQQGQLPFGSGNPQSAAPAPSAPLKPGDLSPVPVPAAPTPVARPNAPDAVGPTRSKLLDAAYQLMATGSPDAITMALGMYQPGLSSQDKLNESAAERAQRIKDMGYQGDISNWASSQAEGRQYQYGQAQGATQENYRRADQLHQDTFTAGQNAAQRNNALQIAHGNNAAEIEAAKLRASMTLPDMDEQAAINQAERDGRLDPLRVNSRNARYLGSALVANPGLNATQLHAMATLDASPQAQLKSTAMETLPAVIGNVRDAGKKLNYSDAAFVGKLEAFKNGQFNDPNFINYLNLRNDAVQQIAQVMGGVGATDMRTKLETDAAPMSMSPRAFDAWYSAQMSSLKPRIEVYERRGLIPKGTLAKFYPANSPAPGGGGKTGDPLVDKYLQ